MSNCLPYYWVDFPKFFCFFVVFLVFFIDDKADFSLSKHFWIPQNLSPPLCLIFHLSWLLPCQVCVFFLFCFLTLLISNLILYLRTGAVLLQWLFSLSPQSIHERCSPASLSEFQAIPKLAEFGPHSCSRLQPQPLTYSRGLFLQPDSLQLFVPQHTRETRLASCGYKVHHVRLEGYA